MKNERGGIAGKSDVRIRRIQPQKKEENMVKRLLLSALFAWILPIGAVLVAPVA